MKRTLARPDVWDRLDDHLQPDSPSKRVALG
jgi:hypothetical protein